MILISLLPKINRRKLKLWHLNHPCQSSKPTLIMIILMSPFRFFISLILFLNPHQGQKRIIRHNLNLRVFIKAFTILLQLFNHIFDRLSFQSILKTQQSQRITLLVIRILALRSSSICSFPRRSSSHYRLILIFSL